MYKKKFGISIIRKNNQYYIIDGLQIYQANELSARILALCNGENSETEIVEKLSQKFSVSKLILQKDVSEFLTELLNVGLITL